jgi:hypothetical protein
VSIITLLEAQTWAERTKLTLSSLDSGLVDQIASQVFSRVARAYDPTGWTSETTTPDLIRSIVAMFYVSWLYSKTFSEDSSGTPEYAIRLLAMAEELIAGLIDGTIDLPDVVTPSVASGPASFYPNDVSSAQPATSEDPSLGPARFTMGTIF